MTNLVPITGIGIHKLASVVFLLLCVIHTIQYRKKLQWKSALLLGTVVFAFLSGLFGMVFDEISLILQLMKQGKTPTEQQNIDKTVQMVQMMMKNQNKKK